MSVARGKILKFNKRRAFNKDIGPGKLINVVLRLFQTID